MMANLSGKMKSYAYKGTNRSQMRSQIEIGGSVSCKGRKWYPLWNASVIKNYPLPGVRAIFDNIMKAIVTFIVSECSFHGVVLSYGVCPLPQKAHPEPAWDQGHNGTPIVVYLAGGGDSEDGVYTMPSSGRAMGMISWCWQRYFTSRDNLTKALELSLSFQFHCSA
jgi:hypothetical protein